MATLSGSARSLVNVHVAVGVRVQATCAGWSGGTVFYQDSGLPSGGVSLPPLDPVYAGPLGCRTDPSLSHLGSQLIPDPR